jgi:hypothetical protein
MLEKHNVCFFDIANFLNKLLFYGVLINCKIMKFYLFFLVLFASVNLSYSQEKSVRAEFLETGSGIWKTGYVYYIPQTDGTYKLTRYTITGVENGRGEYNPNSYPMNVGDSQPKEGVSYKFRKPTGCCWTAYFN